MFLVCLGLSPGYEGKYYWISFLKSEYYNQDMLIFTFQDFVRGDFAWSFPFTNYQNVLLFQYTKALLLTGLNREGEGGRGGGAIWGLGVLERSAMQEWNLWEVEVQEE